MSWPAAAWQASAPATAEMMGVGSYTPEQWAAMQQQNWQQWTQWQEQYAQWQTQYGTKYAEQVKAMQDGSQPPLPPPESSSAACPPPPPDKPPPPPHENNEPLFGATHNAGTPAVIIAPPSHAPAPVSAPFQPHIAQQYYQAPLPADPLQIAATPWAYNTAASWGYNTAQYYQNTSYPPPNNKPSVNQQKTTQQEPNIRMLNQQRNQMDNFGTHIEKSNQMNQLAINAKEKIIDNSQKLSEEEKQFDIQFQKWEEEFENWKKANVNHPDKQAYREYEKKFETCRVQLVERREQMKNKRIAAAGGTAADNEPAIKENLEKPTQKIAEATISAQKTSDLGLQDNRKVQGTIAGDQWRQDGNNTSGNIAHNQWRQDGSNISGNQRQQGSNNMPCDQWGQDNKSLQRDQWRQQGNKMASNMAPNIMPPNNMPGNNFACDQWHEDGNNMPVNNMQREQWRQDENNVSNKNMRQDQWRQDGNNMPGNNIGRDQWHHESKNMPGNNLRHDQWRKDPNNQMRPEGNNVTMDQKQKYHGNDYNTNCDDEYQEDPFAHENDLVESDDKLKFMSQSDPNKGIPGLDLVDKDDRLPDLDDRYSSSDLNKDPVVRKLQDFTDISKGIDNILGDEKILNILSMVSKGQKPPSSEQWGRSPANNMSIPPPNSFNQNVTQPIRQMDDISGPYKLTGDIGGPIRQMGDISGPIRQMGDISGPNRQMGDISGPNRQMSNIGGSNRQMGDIGRPNRLLGEMGGPNRQMGNFGGPNRPIGDIGDPIRPMGDMGGPNRQMGYMSDPNRKIGDIGGPNRAMGVMGGPNRQIDDIGGPNRLMGNIGGSNFIDQNSRLGQPKALMDQRLPNIGPGMMQQSDTFKQQPKPLMDQIITNISQDHMKPSDGMLLKQPPFRTNQQNSMQTFNNRRPQNMLDTSQPRSLNPDFDDDSITGKTIGTRPDYDDIQRNLQPPMGSHQSSETSQTKAWADVPIMEPTIVVDYDHKPLRVKSSDFLEPVHTFDYNHISRNRELLSGDRLTELEIYSHKSGAKVIDYQNKSLNIREETKSSVLEAGNSFMEREIESRLIYPRAEPWVERSRDIVERRYPERSREYRARSRERIRERSRDRRRGDSRERDYYSRDRRSRRPRSRERIRTRSRSKEKLPKKSGVPSHLRRVNARAVDYKRAFDINRIILDAPGRTKRPEKIIIILRGLPGSGKSYVARMILEREVANGGVEPTIFSIDDYFTTEMEITEPDPITGMNVQRIIKQYNYDAQEEHAFYGRLLRDAQKAMDEGSQTFIIIDAVNALNINYYDILDHAKATGYHPYVIEMDMDTIICHRRNIHNRSLEDIEILSTRWHRTPDNIKTLDPRTLLPSEESVVILSDDDMQIESQSDSNEKDNESAVFQRRSRSRSRDRQFNARDGSYDSRDRKIDLSSRNKSLDTKDNKSDAPAATVDKFSNIVMIDDLLESPGREMRPSKIAIIMRGPPGSGKSYVAKLIKDREVENGGSAPRILSIDDYFIQELTEDVNENGRKVSKQVMKYVYDKASEASYNECLLRAFKRTVTDGFFNFIIVDAINDQLKNYAEMWNFAKHHQFHVYISQMELDAATCHKRNIHSRSLPDIEAMVKSWYSTPSHHLMLDATTLLQRAAIHEVHMEDVQDVYSDGDQEDDANQDEEVLTQFTSKWDKMEETDKLARLDGTSKPLRSTHCSMEDYLQLDDWQQTTAKPGKKTVRWADIEERRQQEKMRAIGFVVGQTDWHRMTDPTQGGSALTQTKYIERVRKF